MEVFKKGYRGLVAIGNFLQPFLLLAIRLFWGGSFVMSGWGKFANLAHTAEFFSDLGIPFPMLNAFLTANCEFLCGACLVLGFASRLITVPLMTIMLVALMTAHADSFFGAFSDPETLLKESAFNHLFAVVIVFCFGPGAFSLDRLLGIENKVKT